MSKDEKELLRLVSRMTENEWRQLRIDRGHDEKIKQILDCIGKLRGWTA